MTQATSQPRRRLLHPRRIVLLLAALVGLYLLLPKLGYFHDALGLWHQVRLTWMIVVGAAFGITYLLAAALYTLLAIKRLKYHRTVAVQLASTFANRLLPAGIGAIGVNYEYLRHNQHNRAQASAVIAINNSVGIIGHLALLTLVLLASGTSLHSTRVAPKHLIYWVAASIVIIAGFSLWRKLRNRVLRLLRQTIAVLVDYRHRPLVLVAAFGCSLALTGAYTVSLYACSRALGVDIAFAKIFIVMTLGVIGATAVPTPGGLGGAEAGLVGGLVLYGASSSDALAVALLYRLITYWLSLIVGGAAFIWLQRRQYI